MPGYDFRIEEYSEWMEPTIRAAIEEAGLPYEAERAQSFMREGHILIMRDALNYPMGGAHFQLRGGTYSRSIRAVVTGLYLKPPYRQGMTGVALVRAVERVCASHKHVQSVRWVVRSGGSLDRLLPMLAYRVATVQYEKMVE